MLTYNGLNNRNIPFLVLMYVYQYLSILFIYHNLDRLIFKLPKKRSKKSYNPPLPIAGYLSDMSIIKTKFISDFAHPVQAIES